MDNETCKVCNKLKKLETCFECNVLMCQECFKTHIEKWKSNANSDSLAVENNLKYYLLEIDTIYPEYLESCEQLKKTEAAIEENYNNIVALLNAQRKKLLESLNEIKNQNDRFKNFKTEIEAISQNLKIFRETDPLNEKNLQMNVFIEKYQNNKKMSEKCDRAFLDFKKMAFNKLEKYEKLEPRQDYLGKLYFKHDVNEIPEQANLLNSSQTNTPNSPQAKTPEKKSPIVVESLNKWKDKAKKSADKEFDIQQEFNANKMTIFRNYLYCMNDNGNIIVFTIASNNQIEFTNQFRIDIPKLRSISCNSSYFGVTFSDLESKYYKKVDKNNSLSSGLLLFKRENDKINVTKYEKLLNISGNFKSPYGLALNEEFAFVCDKDLKTLFKININNGQLIDKLTFNDGIPAYCSINQNYVLICDILGHKLCLYDINNFKTNIGNLKIDEYDGTEGPFNVFLTNSNHIIYKYYSDSQLIVTDVNFSEQVLFTGIKTPILSFTLFESPYLTLLIGSQNKKKLTILAYYIK